MAQNKLLLVFVGFVLEQETILKMAVMMNGEDGNTCPYQNKTIRPLQDGQKTYIQ
jgi:hypothetical protein